MKIFLLSILLLLIIILFAIYWLLFVYKNDIINNGTLTIPSAIEIDKFINDYSIQRKAKVSRICSTQFLNAVKQYSEFHKDSINILSNNNSSNDIKIILWRCPPEYKDDCKGLGDRLQGLVTTFLIAIVTNRVMLIEWNNMHTIFEPNKFDWTYNFSFVQGKTVGGVGGNLEWRYCQNEKYPEVCMNPDPTSYTADVIMLNASNRPMSYSMFHDKRFFWWKKALNDKGLTHDYCFGCVLDQIFLLKKRVMETMAPYAFELNNFKSSVSLGIHVRLGDSEMTGHSKLNMFDYDKIFKTDVQQRFNSAKILGCKVSNNITILFLSDSAKLRNIVRNYYIHAIEISNNCTIAKVIIPSIQPKHIDIREYKLIATSSDVQKQREYSYLTTAGEWWLLTLCNYTIIQGDESGFSRTAFAFSFNQGANFKADLFHDPGHASLGHYQQGL